MGRLRKKRAGAVMDLQRRFARRVFLPAAACIALAALAFALYALFTLQSGRGAAVVFSLCTGAALCLALWLLGSAWVRRVSARIDELSAFARRICEGSYGLTAEAAEDGELGRLAGEINALSEEIVRASRVQTEFISSVSHELRTPLTAIGGWAETLEYDEAITGESRRGVEIIGRETGRLTKMVEELLEFTRIQDGRFRLNMERMDIGAEVEDAVFTFSRLSQREELLNLLDNAVKYGRDGGAVEVGLSAQEGWVRITVRDHGPGIPPDELPHVKEKFYKGSGKERGSGIGLEVCDENVARHGGQLSIANAPGGGVLATVLLPVNG